MNSKWMKDLDIILEILIFYKKTGEKLLDIRFGNDFLNTTQKHRQQKQKETMGLHQTEKLLSIKRNNQ